MLHSLRSELLSKRTHQWASSEQSAKQLRFRSSMQDFAQILIVLCIINYAR
jgi:hypothetical protein